LYDKDYSYFELLKQKIVAEMQKSYPGISPVIADWKGQDIIYFQEDLRIRVNANLSEKWFYTHMKSSYSSLPRIDMLNILSRYCGFHDWNEFRFKNKPGEDVVKKINTADRYFILVPLAAIVIVGILYLLFKLFNTQEYRFTFIDSDTKEPVIHNKTEIILLNDGESPAHFIVSEDGSFRLKTDKSKIKMVVKTPYYKPDTIVRMLTKLNKEEMIMLKPDVYMLMIHYFSMMRVDDWEKRRSRLDELIDNAAIIYQITSGKESTGMALYNKQEFIDKLTMPSGSLKNLEILDSQFKEGKITLLRFRINDKNK